MPGKRKKPWRYEPTASDEAHCLHCQHEWIAFERGDAAFLQCPNCQKYTGSLKHLVSPASPYWSCGCGNRYFLITATGNYCPTCGAKQKI